MKNINKFENQNNFNNVCNLSIEKVFNLLNSNKNGLNDDIVKENEKKYGKNLIVEKKRKNKAEVFLEQYKNLLVMLLIVAAIISVFTGGIINTCVILIVITLNAIIGTIQYSKAEKSINSLKKMTTSSQAVIRNGKYVVLKEEEIVVGDILVIKSGDIITADARIIECDDLEVDESCLTGESISVYKNADVLSGDNDILSKKNIVHRGSKVISGKAKAICFAVGMNTEIGKIASLIDNTKVNKSPLENAVNVFSKHLSLIIVIICGIIFLLGIINHIRVLDSLMFAIALAVAAIPEALFTILTIVLAVGTEKMAKENAIVKDLRVVETLGCVDVIATDKTGTLTENKMSVSSVYYNSQIYYDKIDHQMMKNALCLCNDGNISNNNDKIVRTDDAILAFLQKNSIDFESIKNNYKKISEFPFNSKRKIMSTINMINGKKYLFTKGASEIIINKCSKININDIEKNLNNNIINEIKNVIHTFTSEGLRVIGICYKDITGLNINTDEKEENYVFLGLVALSDPPKAGVKEAIKECLELNIEPIMITGDHEETAKSIGRKVGITPKKTLKGIEISNYESFKDVNIFSRVSPVDKIDIVTKIQKDDHITCFVGDGVNDAAAIKKSDVGISMGISGTEVSKEAASIILVDDNYQTIINSIKRGRGIFDNIQNVILYLLGGNIAGLFIVLFTSILDLPVPFAPVHLLFINLINDSLPAIAIGVDDNLGEESKKPRNSKIKILNFKSSIKIIFHGLLLFVSTLASFLIGLNTSIYTARTMAFATLALSRLFHSFNCRGNYSIFKTHKFNKMVYISLFTGLILVNLLLFIPALNDIFVIEALSEYEILVVYFWSLFPVAIIQSYLVLKDIIKRKKRHY